jgi:hypothetical protein
MSMAELFQMKTSEKIKKITLMLFSACMWWIYDNSSNIDFFSISFR